MNGALLWGAGIVVSFIVGVSSAVYREHGRVTLRRIQRFESVPRYVLRELRRERVRALARVDIVAFLISFSLLALLVLIPVGLELWRFWSADLAK